MPHNANIEAAWSDYFELRLRSLDVSEIIYKLNVDVGGQTFLRCLFDSGVGDIDDRNCD